MDTNGVRMRAQYFDIVVTGCGKPAFFSERNLLFAVNPANAALSNTDNGAPILPIVSDDLPTDMPPSRLQVKDTVRAPAPPACRPAEL